jgi:DNA-binding beta-propeller fold protein YncE
MKKPALIVIVAILAFAAAAAGVVSTVWMGRQPDGKFIVSSGQTVDPGTVAFDGRPMDLALHPDGEFFAVLNQRSVFLATPEGVIKGSDAELDGGSSYRGCLWSPDGSRLFVSGSKGSVEYFGLDGRKLVRAGQIKLHPDRNPVPGGMAITRDGKRLFVACANLGAVVEVNLASNERVRQWKAQVIPFEVKLSEDEKKLIVSNWAGRTPEKDEETAESGGEDILVDRRGVSASGTVSIIDMSDGSRRDVAVGLHPAGIAVEGDTAWVANAGSDSISEISIREAKVRRTIPIRWEGRGLFGSMPNTLAVHGNRLYAANGGDNALCEVDLARGETAGFRPAGYFPVGVVLSKDGKTACVVNTKGNGSVRETLQGRPGNAHNFQGTVSVIDLTTDLNRATSRVADLNNWRRAKDVLNPNLPVYKGEIKHVLYIIKENRTYDSIYGDMPEGNGAPELCGLGERITPNHHALAREFTLFDNAYCSGTNSAEGHQWALEGIANDYIERFYGGYTRSYPYEGSDAMAYSSGGFIWNAATAKKKTVRVYGEFCATSQVRFNTRPKDWLEAWKDRASGANRIKVTAGTNINSLRPHIHPNVICWPLLMSDQWRADRFIEDYKDLSRKGKVPNLMLITLPCDHTEGTRPGYPKPASMVADNDLALGRIVDVVSKSPEWKNTCIFVMEDDAQAGVDHVDGHRTVCLAISPYTRRGFVDSTMYTQVSILRSIELMLGLDPMNKLDATAIPFNACFQNQPDPRPYNYRRNLVKLDDMNPPLQALEGKELYWAKKSLALDFSDVDSADWYWLNRIVWHSLHGVDTPYPVM